MTEPPPQDPQQAAIELQVPDELQTGVYANFVTVWHTPYEFTLDFSVMLPAEVKERPDGSVGPVVPARVAARVKLPTTQLFALIRALNENMTIYESNVGPIPQVGREGPLFPPAEGAEG